MRTITLKITEEAYDKFGFSSEDVDFDVLVKRVKNELAKEALVNSQKAAQQAGLSTMSLDEINTEIKAVRDAARRGRH